MLLAQFQPKNDAEAAAFAVGVIIAGLISGGIPFFTGLALRQTAMAITGGIIAGGAGLLAGCCGGIPVALIFTVVIVVMAQNSPPPIQSPWDKSLQEDYDDYVRAVRLPGRDADRRRDGDGGPLPWAEEVRDGESDRRREAGGRRGRQPDRRRESEDDWKRRSEDEEFYRKRGFRPRRPDPGSDF